LGDVRPLDRLRSIRPALQPSGQVREVRLEGLPVVLPRLAVDSGRGVPLQRVVRHPQMLDVVDVVQQRREPHLLVPLRCLAYPFQRTQRAVPVLCPGRVLLVRVPFGQAPSLHPLRRRSSGIVRRLRRYYGPVRLPLAIHRRRTSLDFPTRPAGPSPTGGQGLSRFSREACRRMHGVSDRAGLPGVSRYRRPGCGLPLTSTASASRSKVLSRLNTRPAPSPVNASRPSSRTVAHDSGPVWVAIPSPWVRSRSLYVKRALPLLLPVLIVATVLAVVGCAKRPALSQASAPAPTGVPQSVAPAPAAPIQESPAAAPAPPAPAPQPVVE